MTRPETGLKMKRANIETSPRIVREVLDYIVACNRSQAVDSRRAPNPPLLEITGDQNVVAGAGHDLNIAGRDINIHISVTVLLGLKDGEIVR